MLKVQEFIKTALEASIHADPAAPGLMFGELVDVGRRLGYKEGELADTIRSIPLDHSLGHGSRNVPDYTRDPTIVMFWPPYNPDFRNPHAFDLVQSILHERAREMGAAEARVDRETLITEGGERGIGSHDIEVAITMLKLAGHLLDEQGLIRPTQAGLGWFPTRRQLEQARKAPIRERPLIRELMPIVGDVVARRADGRPKAAEPLDAFQHELAEMGHGSLGPWWRRTVNEFRAADSERLPTAAILLSAALAEAALALVAKQAQDSQLAMTKRLGPNPVRWTFDSLVRAAKTGRDPILDDPWAVRCSELNQARQRIHVGRLLENPESYPRPDARPEEARAAKETAEGVVRRVLDWWSRNRPPTA